jgi:FkbM family methyltransferase
MMIDPLDRVLAALEPANDLQARESATFEGLAGDAREAVIFGSGSLGRIICDGARASRLPVLAFADNNQALWGSSVDGIPILSPADAVDRFNDRAFFIVGVYNSSKPSQQLRQLGCRRVVSYAAFFWKYADTIPWAPGLERPSRIVAAADDMRRGYAALADDRSREEFAAQIAWRCTLDYGSLPPHDAGADIYFPPDLVRLGADEVFVDCGAYDGDSVRLFLQKAGGRFREIYACEPDVENRRKLGAFIETLPPDQRRAVTVLPFAIGGRDGVVHFDTSGTAGSHVTDRQGDAVPCRTIDTLMNGHAPTFIKMDIEGAEPEALGGATSTLRRSRPIVAVCAYHACEHLWTLPQILAAAVPDYEISLRRYAEECWEMVYYAIPPERAAR